MDEVRRPPRRGNISLYMSAPHACSYLPDRDAITAVTDPAAPMDMALYSTLADLGFRRSGSYVYRPQCPACSACVPARIPVAEFSPGRSQRRTWTRNQDLEVTTHRARYDDEHFQLYYHYLQSRHPGGEMDSNNPERYSEFVLSPWSDTILLEFRHQQRLLAVAVCDQLCQGLSAVYTYYDPAEARRALGVYAVLWQIAETQRLGLNWLYLGYWIAACPKMSYKSHYRPLDIYRNGLWQRLSDESAL